MNQFTYRNGGKEELVDAEVYGWLAVYKDETFLKQFDDMEREFHKFAEIDQENLDVFGLYKLTEPTERRYEIHMKEGMKPIHYYRNVVLNAGTKQEQRVRLYHFGYEENVNGVTKKTILQIHPNDAVAILNHDGR